MNLPAFVGPLVPPAIVLAALSAVPLGVAHAASPGAPRPLTVQVSLSPKAEAKLRAIGEAIKVSAFYDGPPIPAKRKLARGQGLISLAPEEATILPAQGGTATFAARVPADKWSWVTEHLYTINVISARKVDGDNLLNCSSADGRLEDPPKEPITITCKLIYGE